MKTLEKLKAYQKAKGLKNTELIRKINETLPYPAFSGSIKSANSKLCRFYSQWRGITPGNGFLNAIEFFLTIVDFKPDEKK